MIIAIENLHKSYGKTKALDGLDLTVEQGSLFAFLGPNGAGKTTAIRIMNSLSRMDSGRVLVNSVDIGGDPTAAKRVCGLASQNVNLDNDLTVMENLDFHGRLYGLPAAKRKSRAKELLDYVQLTDRADSLAKTLSGGMKRRLIIARALLHQPRLLFLDEPTAGLDPEIRRRVWNLIRKINQDGVSVFLTTHYIEEAEALADDVGFINRGKLVAHGPPAAIKNRLGKWSVDYAEKDETRSAHFSSREEANAFAAQKPDGGLVRPVNLEDAFLRLTGRRVH